MQAIYDAGGELALAMTLHDELATTKSGRTYLDHFCAERGIDLFKLRNINDPDAVAVINSANLDWLFIIGWSQIAHSEVLHAPARGVLGMHPTLLPIGRGRAAIPWAILLGLPETGVTLFKLDQGVDTGPIVAQHRVPITERETATSLYEKIDAAHTDLIKYNWQPLMRDQLHLVQQEEAKATTWPGRKPEDGALNASMSVDAADRLIRAVTHPYPGAFMEEGGERIRIWSAGAPQENCGGDDASSGVRRLRFRDGWLDAVTWVKESRAKP